MGEKEKLHHIVERDFLSSLDNKSHIYCKHYFPTQKLPKRYIHVIFQHGMIEYHQRHEELYNSLRKYFKNKIVISVMDLVGHGLSGGYRAYVDSIDTYTKDMYQFFDQCSEVLPESTEVKTIIISHSLGGLITLKAVTHEEFESKLNIDSLIFTNPCFAPKIELPRKSLSVLDGVPDFIGQIKLPSIYSAKDLTSDPEREMSFIHDHLISKSVSIKLISEINKATKNINSLSYFMQYPCFFILSGNDRLVDNEKTKLFITGMSKELVELKEYPRMLHDILNETCRSDVFREIIQYIEQRFK